MSQKTTFCIFAAVLGILATASFLILENRPLNTPQYATGRYRVVLGNGGFNPQTMTVAAGEKIEFQNARTVPFWPASDIHPTHDVYPEFDPKKPIAAGESWIFHFDRPGVWRYHDHLAPSFRGVIVVRDPRGAVADPCAEDNRNTSECWGALIERVAARDGFHAAFRLFLSLSEKNPSFNIFCHDFAHRLGEAAYGTYRAKGALQIHPQMMYCGFGFYHGLVQRMTAESGRIEDVRKFCVYVENELRRHVLTPSKGCYHGAGHGLAEILVETEGIKNERALAQRALAACESIASDDYERNLCATGVFDSVAIMYYNGGKNGIAMNPEDPLALCLFQPASYKQACYDELMTAVLWAANNRVIDAIPVAERFTDKSHLPATLTALIAAGMRYRVELPAQETVAVCGRWSKGLSRDGCITGVVDGYMQFGGVGKEYKKAIAFCREPGLNDNDRRSCFTRTLHLVATQYGRERYDDICDEIPPEYRSLCASR